MFIKNRFIQTDDNETICYQYFYARKKETLVFIHGVGGCAGVWQPYIEALIENYNILTMDLRGHGLSSRPKHFEQYQISHFIKDALQVIQKENIQDCYLVGHSLGAMVCLGVTSQIPDRIRGMIILGIGDQPTFPLLNITSKPYVNRTLQIIMRYLPRWHRSSHREYSQFKHTKHFSISRFTSDLAHTSLKSYAMSMLAASRFDAMEFNHSKIKNCLIIAAQNDVLFDVDSALCLHRYLLGSQCVFIKKAEHHFIVTHPKSILENMMKFSPIEPST